MKQGSMPMVNLIPQEQIVLRVRSIWTRRWIGGVIFTTLVIGIPGVYIGGRAALTETGMAGQIQDASLEYEKQQQAIPLLRQRIEQLAAEQEVLDLIKNRIEWRDVFTLLVDSAGNDVRFSHLNAVGAGIEGDEPIEIYLEGLAPSQTAVRAYVVNIEATQVFDSIELIETTREVIEEVELIRFKVMIRVNGTGIGEGKDAG